MTVVAPSRALAPPSRAATFAALVRRGVRDRRRAPLTWGGALGALAALEVAIWPSIASSIDKAVAGYPDAIKEAFGITRIASVESYLDVEMFSLILPLAMGFLAVRIVASAIAGAEERGELDTLLAAPVDRRVLVAASLASTALTAAAVALVTGAIALLAGLAAGSGLSAWRLAVGLVAVWALAMLFAGLAALVAGLVHRASIVTGVAMGALVTMYVLDVAGKVDERLAPLRWVSAFRWYDSPVSKGIDVLAVAGFLLVGAACAAAGALAFERRDVH